MGFLHPLGYEIWLGLGSMTTLTCFLSQDLLEPRVSLWGDGGEVGTTNEDQTKAGRPGPNLNQINMLHTWGHFSRKRPHHLRPWVVLPTELWQPSRTTWCLSHLWTGIHTRGWPMRQLCWEAK